MALTDNLVAYWKLDEASGNRADSHGSYTLTDTNTVASATGKINNCASFTAASSERLTNSAVALTNGTAGFAVSAWFKTTTTALRPILTITKTTVDSTRWFFMIETAATTGYINTEFGFVQSGNQGVSYAGTTALNDGNWHHVAVNVYNNGTPRTVMETYIDGALVNTATHATYSYTMPTNFEFVAVGANRNYTADTYARYWDDEIDEVGIWDNYKLTASDVTALYNLGNGLAYPFTANTTDFFAYF